MLSRTGLHSRNFADSASHAGGWLPFFCLTARVRIRSAPYVPWTLCLQCREFVCEPRDGVWGLFLSVVSDGGCQVDGLFGGIVGWNGGVSGNVTVVNMAPVGGVMLFLYCFGSVPRGTLFCR